MNSKDIQRDGTNVSPWQTGLKLTPADSRLHAKTIYDCLVIGAGITGITTALILQKAGKQTILVDAHTVGFGTTGGTSAHVNTFADTTYSEAESAFGEEGARLFAEAIRDGIAEIDNNIKVLKIACDYEIKPGYLYAETDDEVKQLDDIYQGAVKVGIDTTYTGQVPTPVPYKKALLFNGQAQFHPLKYIQGLHKAYLDAGGTLLEHTRVESLEHEEGIHTAGGMRARNVVYATHMPPNINVFNFECAPYRSYVMAVKLKSGQYPEALIYDTQDPYHYVRSHSIEGEVLLIAGGLDHKTGHDDPEKAFADLEKYIRKYYNVSSVKYRWSSQYHVPVDGLPYIGQMPMTARGVYCATGYNGNGMMLGSVAGRILSDLVLGKDNKYAALFNPARIKPVDSFTEFVKENADVAYHFIADRFSFKETDSIKRLRPGTGKLVEIDGEKVAAYRDEDGNVHTLSPVCTHAGCIVSWNAAEKSWDCPCHGARYDVDGHVLTGPATRDLLAIDLKSDV